MADNFRILVHRSSESLHIKLFGDFDDHSAYEVIHTLLENKLSHRIFIHTAEVNKIRPFGKAIFQENFPFKNPEIKVIFTGEHANEISPKADHAALADKRTAREEIRYGLRKAEIDDSHG